MSSSDGSMRIWTRDSPTRRVSGFGCPSQPDSARKAADRVSDWHLDNAQGHRIAGRELPAVHTITITIIVFVIIVILVVIILVLVRPIVLSVVFLFVFFLPANGVVYVGSFDHYICAFSLGGVLGPNRPNPMSLHRNLGLKASA
jgi:hypothetical protein